MNRNDNISYERVLKPPRNLKNSLPLITLCLLYLLFLGLCLIPLLYFGFTAELLLLIPFSLLLLVLPTWKYGFCEYEYIFCGQSFCFSKIYGNRKRKQIMDLDLSDAILISPVTDETLLKAETKELSTVIYATLDNGAPDVWMILFEVDKKETGVVFFHADERSIRFLRRANPHATPKQYGSLS